tara:strand:- start:323 stop:652 length:330 start_codon:yes stop_codon:yes gene_type:complete
MSKIKFKQILKEAAWDHTSGKALPTLEDVQKAYEAKKHLQEEEETEELEESPNQWKRMDGLHNVKLMKSIEKAALTIAEEFAEDGFEANDIRSWFDRTIYMNVIKKTRF